MDNVFTLLEQEEQAEQKLLRDMVDACCTLQRLLFSRNASEEEAQLYRGIFYSPNTPNYEHRESNRNAMIGAYLQAKGYVLSDPAILNSDQKHALDMDIRRTGNIPWTFCEAINLREISLSGSRLFSALERTLAFAEKYAFPFYFLIGYVKGAPDDFAYMVSDLQIEFSFAFEEGYFPLSQTNMTILQEEEGYFIQGTEMIYECNGFPVKIYILFVLTENEGK